MEPERIIGKRGKGKFEIGHFLEEKRWVACVASLRSKSEIRSVWSARRAFIRRKL
jgi:hypothetical protein